MRENVNMLPYTGQSRYKFNTHGFSYDLPLVKVEKNKYIAWLDTLGETKLVTLIAKTLSKELAHCDILVTLEPYGLEFAHSLATLIKKDKFVVCRNKKYNYMIKPIHEYWGPKNNIKSAVFYLDSRDAELIKGKRVGIVDEIVGARRAMDAMERLVKRAGGRVVKRVAMFSDGEKHQDITCFGILPVFIVSRPNK